MNIFIISGWIGVVLTCLSQYIIILKKWQGFLIGILGNIFWIVSTHELCVVIINIIFILINLKGIYTWTLKD